MADLPPYDSDGDAGDDAGRGSPPGTPRWVYVFGIVALVLILLFVILHLAGGGLGHHHTSSGGRQAPTSSVAEHGTQQP